MAAAPGVRGAAPVDALPALGERDEDVAGVRGGERGPEAAEAVGVIVADQRPAPALVAERTEVAAHVPMRAAAIVRAAARAKAELAAARLDHRLDPVVGRRRRADRLAHDRAAVRPREPGDDVGPLHVTDPGADVGVAGGAAALVDEHVDLRRARGRRDRELRGLGRIGGGLEDAPLLPELGGDLVRVLDVGLPVVGHQDHGVGVEEGVHPPAGLDQLAEAAVGVGDRGRHRLRAEAVGVVVVVGEREEQEVVGVVGDELLRDAGRVLVAGAGPGERRLARDRPAAEQLAEEELVRPVDRVAEPGGDRAAAQQAVEPKLVAGAAPVDQERGAGGAHARIAQRLEEGLHLGREVGHVHVVDDVVGGPEQAERAGRLERRAVLDVAPLDPVEPVHSGDPVPVGGDAGGDLRGADRCHRGERGDEVRDQLAAREERAEVRRLACGDGLLELVGAQRVDEDEAELAVRAAHLSERSPSYFSPAAWRRVRKSQSVAIRAGIEISATGPSSESPARASA